MKPLIQVPQAELELHILQLAMLQLGEHVNLSLLSVKKGAQVEQVLTLAQVVQ